jgi:hypothetical protein
MIKTATISYCGFYRYDLTRRWEEGGTTCAFIGLNPSTADADIDDPTVRRCIGFAKNWGHSQLVMINAYAYRATNPENMKEAENPVGPMNNEYLMLWSEKCEIVVAAWGTNITRMRQQYLKDIIKDMFILRLTKNGFPSHPLYLPKNLSPIKWQK